jgi:hypothetical protein
MKKATMLAVIVLALSAALLLSACGTSKQTAEPSEKVTDAAVPATAETAKPSASQPAAPPSPSASPSTSPSPSTSSSPSPSPSPSPEQSPAPSPSTSLSAQGFEFDTATYSKGGISIKYPQIKNSTDAALQDKLNKFIADAALRDLPDIKDDPTLTDYQIATTVTLNTPEVLSMYFEGYANYTPSAHPYQFLYTLTVDVEKLEPVALPQLVSIRGDDIVSVLLGGTYSTMSGYDITDEIKSSITDYLNSFDNDFWMKEFENADTAGASTVSYLTPDSLVVSVSVPHVMGDHIEISLKFKQLWGHQTDNLLWKDIEK